ncbi:hypothetical protein RUW63_27310, partial [Klebsiella pneumoniae]|nr:hypothetical protein [Klebsiella pneumoniae]MDT9963255.1 hypothetical protein [Klebsiella pneumoniae]
TVCVVGKMRDLILQLSKSSIYSTKPFYVYETWFSLIKCPDEIRNLSKRIIRYQIGLKTLL